MIIACKHRPRSWLKLWAVFGTASLSITAFASNPVDYVDLAPGDGIYVNDGKITVTAANGQYTQVSSGNTVSFHQRLKAGCQGMSNVLQETTVYAGSVSTPGGIMEANDYYSAGVAHQFAKEIPFKDVTMNVPLNKLGFNPVQVCNDMLHSKQQQGMNAMQVLNSDHTIAKPFTFSGVASCGKISGDHHYDKDYLNAKIDVICKAGGAGPVNNIQQKDMVIPAVPLGGNGTLQAGYNPLDISEAGILADSLQYTGACPKMLNFTARFKGNGKGQVRYSIVEKGKQIFKSAPLSYDGSDGWKQNHFNYNIPVDNQNINKKMAHSFSIYIEVKDEKADGFEWSKHNSYPSLQWHHTCQAGPAVPMGHAGSLQTAPTTPAMELHAPANIPDPDKQLDLKAATPVKPDPQPGLNLHAPVHSPGPKPMLNMKAPANTPDPAPSLGVKPTLPKPGPMLPGNLQPKPATPDPRAPSQLTQ